MLKTEIEDIRLHQNIVLIVRKRVVFECQEVNSASGEEWRPVMVIEVMLQRLRS